MNQGDLALIPRSRLLLAHPGLVKEGPIQGSRPPAVLVNALKDLRPRLWRECWWPWLQLLHLHAADKSYYRGPERRMHATGCDSQSLAGRWGRLQAQSLLWLPDTDCCAGSRNDGPVLICESIQ